MAVSISLDGPEPKIGVPRQLFEMPYTGARAEFDVSADGQKFLFVTLADGEAAPSIQVMTNWRAALKKPAK